MPLSAFTLGIPASVTVQCEFWVENDGWIGTAKQLGITVHAGSFENAKLKMEDALSEYVESLVRSTVATKRKIA